MLQADKSKLYARSFDNNTQFIEQPNVLYISE